MGGLGFKQTTIEFEAPARHAGVSKFSMKKMLHFAMDGIITNSTLPLRMAFYMGFFAAIVGILVILHVLYCVITDQAVPGWATMTILTTVFGSMNLMCLGIIGEYISRISEESRNRPLYWLADDTATHLDNPYHLTHKEP